MTPDNREPTPGCWICDPESFYSDEEPCSTCEADWIDFVMEAVK